MKFFRKLLVMIASLAVVFAAPATVSVAAISEEQLYIFGQNGIYFWNPDGGCVGNAVYARDAESFGGLSAEQVAFVETYHDIAVQNSINYGIPWETVVAQGILESASGTSNFAIYRNNFFGIGAFDSNPNAAYSYETPEQGWEGYYINIQRTSTYRNHGVFAGDTVTDPYAYLVAIKAAGYATDENYIAKVSKLIDAIVDLSTDRGWKSSEQLASAYPEWLENAEANRQGAEAGSIAATAYSLCGAMGLISGGMTLAEAQEFMEAYINESNKFARGNFMFDGALVTDSGCPSGTMNNCSAFTQWFLNRYTSVGPDGAIIHQGSMAVQRYLSEIPDLIDGGKVPRVYAIVSMGPYEGSADGWGNHTGIVLGIDEDNNQIIIGEASCGASNGARNYPPGAHSYALDKYTNSSSTYGPTYAYTDNILKGL